MSYINKNNFIKAVKFIHDNVDRSLEISDIAKAVGLSESSLKRLFKEATDQSVGSFVRMLRMEYAFSELSSQKNTILEIALNNGFGDHSAFSRSFKQMFGYSPLEGKKKLNIINELESAILEEPEFVELHDIVIQSVTKQGLYYECAPQAWQAFKNIVQPELLEDDSLGLFIGIGHDNPHDGEVSEDKVRFTAGVTLTDSIPGLIQMIIPGGAYAKFRFTGKLNNIGAAYHYIYGGWRTEHPECQIDDTRSAFLIFDRMPDGFLEHDVMISVPLKRG